MKLTKEYFPKNVHASSSSWPDFYLCSIFLYELFNNGISKFNLNLINIWIWGLKQFLMIINDV